MAKLTVDELETILDAEKADALSSQRSSKLSEERSKAMEYYLGDMAEDMPAQVDRSSAVSSDVADVVEGLMPALMEIFCGGDEVVEFEPIGQEDEEAAQQETDYVNHVFLQQNDGYLVIYSMTKDALLQKNGIAKVWWEVREHEEEETYVGLDDDAYAMIVADEEVEITEHAERPDTEALTRMLAEADQALGIPEGDAFQMEIPPEILDRVPKLHDLTVVKRANKGRCRVEAVPPEEFGISRRAKTIRDADYCFHETRRTVHDLIEEGYEPDQVHSLATASFDDTEEAMTRNTINDTTEPGETGVNEANRLVRTTEHYAVIDYEGNGKPCPYKIVTGGEGGEVLNKRQPGEKKYAPDITKVRRVPFASMTPIIIPHRFFGRSMADVTMDIQRIKTSLIRSLLDNMYLANNQRTEIAEMHAGPNTIDDLLTNRPGGIVRTKTPGGLNVLQSQSIGPFGFPLVEYFDGVREWRTGVTRQGMGLDPNALQNIGENAILDAANASRQKQKLIARTFAETGIRDLFLLIHDTIRANDDKANTVRLRNKWVTINPREWKTRSNLIVNVGIGDGTKAQQLAFLTTLLTIQKEALMMPQAMLVKPGNIYATLKKYTELGGLRSVEPYFMDPEEKGPDGQLLRKPPPPPPDPKLVEIQAKMALESQQAKADIAAQDRKVQAEIVLKTKEFELKRELMLIEARLKMHEQNRQIMGDVASETMEEDAETGSSPYNQMVDGLRMQQAAVEKSLAKVQAQIEAAGQAVATIANATSAIADSVGQVAGHAMAPSRVIRDGGRIVGVEKNGVRQSVVRGPDGAIEGLQ